MEYNRIKTRIKNKLTKEYKKTQHTEEYLGAESAYKKTRESIKLFEVEIQNLMDAFSNSTLYENIASGLYSGFEKMRETLKGAAKSPRDSTKELPDAFSTCAGCASTIAQSTLPNLAEKYNGLSHSLKKISATRLQFKDDLAQNLNIIREIKEKAKQIDDDRVDILNLRQLIESAKNSVEEERLKDQFADECKRIYDEMREFGSSKELSEIADGLARALRSFFGDAFDAISDAMPLEQPKR